MIEDALPNEEYDTAIEQIGLLTKQLENAEPEKREELQAEIHRLLVQAVDVSLTDDEKQSRDNFIQHNVSAMEYALITQDFVYPVAKVIEQQTKREIQSQLYEFKSITFDGQTIYKIPHQGRHFREDLGVNTLEMVCIPSGSFLMGDSSAKDYACWLPQHLVTVPAFSIGKFAITQAQWVAIMEDNSSANGEDDGLPVDSVSWDDATEFCQRLSRFTGRKYRLPSEAEWEYACRAGTTTAYSWGDEIDRRFANYFDFDSQAELATKPVGSYAPNAFGLYDMHGNVFEFCQDRWHNDYEDAPINGSAWLGSNLDDNKLVVIRGGSFDYYANNCLSSERRETIQDYRYHGTGFRVASDAALD
ncbi:formylglycine-generating enzyme family protein [Chamaesiphon sp.]|uniref:formylglycine-generating enzyme family protein n=1 Tax=Chamaesiphon sp. TaxID=2814140 RepID=UPI003593ED1B